MHPVEIFDYVPVITSESLALLHLTVSDYVITEHVGLHNFMQLRNIKCSRKHVQSK